MGKGTGKGKDDGAAYAIIFVLVTIALIIGGIVLLIIGAVQYNKDAEIDTAGIDSYNTRVASFENGGETTVITNTWATSTTHPNSVYQYDSTKTTSFTAQSEFLSVARARTDGDDDDAVFAKNTTSIFGRALMEEYEFNSSTFTFSFNSISTVAEDGSWRVTVPMQKFFSGIPIVCNVARCSKDDDGDCNTIASTGKVSCDDVSILSDACETIGGPNATYRLNELLCQEEETCGTCEYSGFLSKLCVVIDITMLEDGTAALSQRLNEEKLSCKYPFTDQEYSGVEPNGWGNANNRSLSSLPVEIRSSNDPEIVLEELTKGSRSFVLAEDGKRRGRTILITGGICLGLGICGAIIIILFLCCLSK